MTHFACPLCGKNVAMSTFTPENFELDVKGFSYKGMGHAKGFMKVNEHSILGDEEISPVLAKRVLHLCDMFLKTKLLSREDIENTIGSTSNLNQLYKSLIEEKKKFQETIFLLQTRIKEVDDEELINSEVDYILKCGLEFSNDNCLVVDEYGWGIALSDCDIGLELYLNRVIIRLPNSLKNKLLQRIKPGDDEGWYENMLKNAPRKKDLMESMIPSCEVTAVHVKDASGEERELLFEPVEFDYIGSTLLPFESIKSIVDEIKNALKDPNIKRSEKILFGH